MDDADRRARDRLLIFTLVRFACVAVFIVGVATIYGNLLRTGGWPQLGALICIVAALASVLVPHAIKRRWDRRQP